MKASLLSGAIIVAVSGLFGYHNIHLRLQQQLQAVQQQQQLEQQTQELRTQLAVTLEQVEQFRKRLAPSPETQWLMEQVNPLAAQAGVQLTGIRPQNPSPLTDFTSLAVHLEFTGSFHQVGAFLSALESAPVFIRVSDLDISAPNEQGASQVQLILTTMYVPPLEERAPETGGAV